MLEQNQRIMNKEEMQNMRFNEFEEKVWRLISQARNKLETAHMNAFRLDEPLNLLITEALAKIMSAQARCSELTRIGTK